EAVEHNGIHMLDGGIVDPLPIVKAESDGLTKNVVVLTKPRGYYKKPSKISNIENYKKYPKVDERMKIRYKHYNDRIDYICEQEEKGYIIVIATSVDADIGRTTRKRNKLEQIYELRISDAKEKCHTIKSFINE